MHPSFQPQYQQESYSDEELYESEEEESEQEFEESEEGSQTTSELSEYKIEDEMRGFYKNEKFDPARSSLASQSLGGSLGQ